MTFVRTEAGLADEPEVREEYGLTDIAIDGFVLRGRGSSVRLIGFMRRGDGEREIIEPTVAIHLPRDGWDQSLMAACRRMQEAARGLQ